MDSTEVRWQNMKRRLFYVLGLLLFCLLAWLHTLRFNHQKVFEESVIVNITNQQHIGADDIKDSKMSSQYKYVTNGANINCKKTCLDTSTPSESKFAYVWYATNHDYLCSALVAMKQLQTLRKSQLKSVIQVDYVLIYRGDKRDKLLNAWVVEGGLVEIAKELPNYLEDNYYKFCLHKFDVFKLTKYTQVVFMDSDAFALQSLDILFHLKFPENTSIAAPQGYWFPNEGFIKSRSPKECFFEDKDGFRLSEKKPELPFPVISSILLVVKPSDKLYQSVAPYFGKWILDDKGKPQRQLFDMDIINRKFSCHGKIVVLPKHFGTLNAEYMDSENLSRRFGRCKNITQVHLMHFSAQGKPWTQITSLDRQKYVLRYAREARPFVQKWFDLQNQMCH